MKKVSSAHENWKARTGGKFPFFGNKDPNGGEGPGAGGGRSHPGDPVSNELFRSPVPSALTSRLCGNANRPVSYRGNIVSASTEQLLPPRTHSIPEEGFFFLFAGPLFMTKSGMANVYRLLSLCEQK